MPDLPQEPQKLRITLPDEAPHEQVAQDKIDLVQRVLHPEAQGTQPAQPVKRGGELPPNHVPTQPAEPVKPPPPPKPPARQTKGKTTGKAIVSFKGGMRDWFLQNKTQIQAVLPTNMDWKRFARVTIEALTRNPKLATATPDTLALSIMKAAADGLEPDGEKACIVPYRNKNRVEAQYQKMYGGVLEHCYRTQMYEVITYGVVHEGDHFVYKRGFPDHFLEHEPAAGDRGPVIGYWAGYKLKGGGYDFVYLPKEVALAHGRKFSKQFNNSDGPWQTNTDAMCIKTALLQVVKYAPKSREPMALPAQGAHKPPADDDADFMRVVGNERISGMELLDTEQVEE